MSWFVNFFRSAIGKKVVMALTGIILFGFVFTHLLGNLKLYLGSESMNHYGEWLREIGSPALPHSGLLWILRIGLLVATVLHIWSAWSVTMMNRRARPIAYSHVEFVQATYASRTMRSGGVIVLLFVIYHLMHLTWGNSGLPFEPGKPYENVVRGFSVWWVSAFYILAQVALGLHLYHGLWSMFQSMGWNHPKFNSWRRYFATAFALFITVGNISFPLAVLLGVVR